MFGRMNDGPVAGKKFPVIEPDGGMKLPFGESGSMRFPLPCPEGVSDRA